MRHARRNPVTGRFERNPVSPLVYGVLGFMLSGIAFAGAVAILKAGY